MAYIANMPDGQLPAWLSADRLMFWTLRALISLLGQAHLDALYKRLGQLLRIPEDLLWLEHPTGARQEDYVVRHRMRLGLTDMKHLGLVDSDDRGQWRLKKKGIDFLRPLALEDETLRYLYHGPFPTEWRIPLPTEGRQWTRETGIELTPAENLLSDTLIADKRADYEEPHPPRSLIPPDMTTVFRREWQWRIRHERPWRKRESFIGPDELLSKLAEYRRNVEKFTSATSRAEEISRFFAPLDPREIEILKFRFGLDSGEPRSLEEAAEHFGMPREEIRRIEARAMSKLRRLSQDSPRALTAAFEGTCVICDEPINIGDAIAIQYQRAKPTDFFFRFSVSSHDAPPAVEGWRHDHCPRSGPGGARVPARVPPPGNPPKESAVRRRLFPAEDDD